MTTGSPDLTIDSVSVAFGPVLALERASATLPPGTVTGLIGPNGSGKSTLIRTIAGVIRPRSGRVLYRGEPLNLRRTSVAHVPQAREVDWDFPLSACDVVMMGRYRRIGWLRRPGRAERERVETALAEVGLYGLGDRHICQFSGGQQQRIFLARALVQQPEIVLLDEPMTGIDVTTRRAINDLIRRFADQGAVVLLATHDLDEVQTVCDRLICLNRRVVAAGPIESVYTPEILRATFGGQVAVFS